MGPPAKVNFDDDYDESADEDYNPDAKRAGDDGHLSGSESDVDNDHGAPASGDEAVSSNTQKKKVKRAKRARKPSKDLTAPDDGDTGRQHQSMRTRASGQTRDDAKDRVSRAAATADVDAIFSRMSSANETVQPTQGEGVLSAKDIEATQSETQPTLSHSKQPDSPRDTAGPAHQKGVSSSLDTSDLPLGHIRIKRSYEFAGQTMQEEKIVPADSAEAKLWLQQQESSHRPPVKLQEPVRGGPKALRRPIKRRAAFGDVEATAAKPSKGPKLNTLQKSKLDWASHVDQEGLNEELDVHSKAKEGYLSRMDFLGRMDAKREDGHRK